nr:Uncharacterised protein [Klebsiella pneumoniae]
MKLIIGDKEIYGISRGIDARAHYCWSRMV